MSNFQRGLGELLIAGGLIALDIFAPALGIPLSVEMSGYLISAGVGLALSGVGTLLSKGPLTGLSTASRNPIAPWNVVYGRSRVGGTIVFIEETGEADIYLHLVIVLACHPCESVDAVLFDGKRVCLDTTGNSLSFDDSTSVIAEQQEVGIAHITRGNNIVTVTLLSPMPLPAFSAAGPALLDGDQVSIHDVPGDLSLNGIYSISVIDSLHITYLCYGLDADVVSAGYVSTTWADYGDTVHMETVLGDHTTTFPGLLDPFGPGFQPLWTANHKLLGRTAAYLRLKYGGDTYTNGMPAISFLMHGRNEIYDPRDSSTGYTENAALCIADYLAHQTWGFKAAYGTEIPADELVAAANICDETVDLASGNTESRYTCNGQFPVTMRRGEVLQNMLTSCAGRLTYVGGAFVIHPAAWTGVSGVAVVDYSKLAGPFQWKPKVAVRELYNGVKGTYISPVNNWQSSDFPAYAQDEAHGYTYDANLLADGGDRRWLDIQLPFTSSSSAAQRIAKIELLRRRQQGTGTFTFSMALYQTTALDIVSFTLPVLGWDAKLLEIAAHRFTLNKQSGADGADVTVLGTEIDVQETAASVYDWTSSEETASEGYSQAPALPDTTRVAAPTGVTATSGPSVSVVGADGIARSRILVHWTAPADGYVLNGGHVEIQYQVYSSPLSTTWTGLPSVDPGVTQILIDSVTDGVTYRVQVRFVNTAGAASAWVSAAPVTVSGTASSIDPGGIDSGGATTGQVLVWNGTAWVPGSTPPGALGITIDGGGSVPTTGSKGFIQTPYAGTITGWTIISNLSGSAQITVKKSTYAAFPTTASIVASAPPVLTAAQDSTSTTLTGWTTAVSTNDIFEFNLDSVTTCTRITFEMKVNKT